MERQYNLRSPAVKRLMREAQELREPTEIFYAQPLEDNLFEWHFTIRGPADTEFDGGIYHGRIVLPPEYPMKPPSIILLTPNGRFELFKKICLSISGHHPESWQPSWSIRTALLAIIGFMPTHGSGAIGALDYTPEERKLLAKKSCDWQCPDCGPVKDILKPLTEASKSDSQEAKELASQINFQAEKQTTEPSSNQESSTSDTSSAAGASSDSNIETPVSAASTTPASTPAAASGPATATATAFPFPPSFNPAIFGGRMPMPGFPPMMGYPTPPGSASARPPMNFMPHPLLAAQMGARPVMGLPFHPQGQMPFQQMFEQMQRTMMQRMPNADANRASIAATPPVTSASSPQVHTPLSASNTPPVTQPDTELRQRRPAPPSPTPSQSSSQPTPSPATTSSPLVPPVSHPTPSPSHPVPAPQTQPFTSAEIPNNTARSENPFVIFLVVVLSLAIIALIMRRMYKFNLWNFDNEF